MEIKNFKVHKLKDTNVREEKNKILNNNLTKGATRTPLFTKISLKSHKYSISNIKLIQKALFRKTKKKKP